MKGAEGAGRHSLDGIYKQRVYLKKKECIRKEKCICSVYSV